MINDGSNDFYIIKDAPLPAGSTIQLAGGGQKIVLEENDLINQLEWSKLDWNAIIEKSNQDQINNYI